MQADEAQVAGGRTLTAGSDGHIRLSANGASAVPVAEGPDGAALFAVDAIRVGAGETLVVATNGRAARLDTRLLEVGEGGRVVSGAFLEIHAERAVFAPNSVIELVGADGGPGTPGGPGAKGNPAGYYNGGIGGIGNPGHPGDPGPGGNLFIQEISGTLTVVAGGGNGGAGGSGGAGGAGAVAIPGYLGSGGNGGVGGAGGNGGEGGTVMIAYGTFVAGSVIQPVVRGGNYGHPGAGGAGGAGANGYSGQGVPGILGQPGAPGANGNPPVFMIRHRD